LSLPGDPAIHHKDAPAKMPTEIETTRKAILRATRKIGRTKRLSPRVFCALKKPGFPLSFFVRNMLALRGENAWRCIAPRIWKGHLHRLLEERSRIFLEVSIWRLKNLGKKGSAPPSLESVEPSGYCNHCGGCCEIASGFPDFPCETVIPLRWQRLFGDGLGKGHRFCAFLWEINASGRSICAIHPWRSHPCRAFEEAECAFFMKDLKAHPLFRPLDFSMACRRLSRLIDRR
jgi:hypothetical protein